MTHVPEPAQPPEHRTPAGPEPDPSATILRHPPRAEDPSNPARPPSRTMGRGHAPKQSGNDEPPQTILRPDLTTSGENTTVLRPGARADPGLTSATAPTAELPSTPVGVPVFRPHRAGRVRLAVLMAVAVAAAAMAGYVAHRPHAVVTQIPQQFHVSTLKVTGPTTALHCPTATLRIDAVVGLDGEAGVVRYDWLLPDGAISAPQSVAVLAGQTSASITLTYTLAGAGQRTGTAALHLLAPADVYSAPVPVAYVCP